MSILKTVADNILTSFLSSLIYDGSTYIISNIWNGDKDLEKLKETHEEELRRLRRTLESINANLSHLDLPSDWLEELEHYRYEIEDIEESMKPEPKKKLVQKFLEANIRCIAEMQTMLRRREEDMEAGLSKRKTTKLELDRVPSQLMITTSLRMGAKNKIIEELKMRSSDAFGVSIVGICGIGKTILAKAVADEASIKEHFPCILNPPPSPSLSSGIILDHIQGARPSKDKRVLILLDGLHSVTPEGWRHFWNQCQEVLNPDSKFLITTRNPRVAHVTGTSKHCLHPLSGDECFSLIQNGAKANRNLCEVDDYAIEHNRKELVDMCRGLPLLANQIGFLLSATERGQRLGTIKEITRRELWKVPDLEKLLVDLKYIFLQDPHLKRCLAYCSLFPPQDYEFKEENLVQFWMAEGFAQQPSRDANYMEQTARKCFDELVSYSLFQASETPPGETPSYKMLELAYDLAQNVASKTFCQKHIGNSISTSELSNTTRHFSLSCDNNGEDDEIIADSLLDDIQKMCSGLRTFLLFHGAGKNIHKNPTFFQSLTRIRVLDLSHTNLTKLYISELKHLRYLDLSHTPVENLPKLSKNPELQVLKLNYCDNLLGMPKDLAKLTNLISLQVNPRGLGSMPSGIGKLTNLQRLNVFIAGKREGFKIAELENLNNLRNSIRVTKLENVETEQEAQGAKLHVKGRLEKLELEWSSSAQNEAAKQVLQGLTPPKNLKELKIKNYSSTEFPKWISRAEICGLLEYIHLDCCKALPSIERLPLLKTLHVEAMHEITRVGNELFGRNGRIRRFPRLETLVLCDMPELDRWIRLAARHMPYLCNLRVEKCHNLLSLPRLSSFARLEKLEIIRCSKLQELPILPTSLESLIIKHSDILRQRYQVGHSNWFRIKGINVEIDCRQVDME